MNHPVTTVLFDLDGTLLDTAPDLANALNAVLQANGRPPLAYEAIRPVVSHGGRALIELGFGLTPGEPEFEPLRRQLLRHYQDHIADHTRLFPGMDRVLRTLGERGIGWGVVTNKPGWLTVPLLQRLDLARHARCVVSGDTLDQRKPHPAPLLHACELSGAAPGECLYVGDAKRDIEAGHRAGMRTLVAMFGYLMEADRPERWGADALIHQPGEILDWLETESV